MPIPSTKGDLGPIPQGYSFDYDPREGFNFQKPLRGTLAVMLGYSAQLYAARVPHSFTQDGPDAEIVIRSSRFNDSDNNEETPIDDWEVQANTDHHDLFEHPKAIAIEAAEKGALAKIKKAVQDYNDQTLVDPTITIAGGPAIVLNANRLIRRLVRGGTQFARPQYVLVHTQAISTAYQKNIDDSFVEQIYDFNQLRTEITDSSLVVKCPGRIIAKLEAAFNGLKPTLDAEDATHYKWGFLKEPSPERLIAGNRIQITTSYTLEMWSLFEYDAKAA